MAESHISLLVVRKIVRAINHASSVRAIQRMNRSSATRRESGLIRYSCEILSSLNGLVNFGIASPPWFSRIFFWLALRYLMASDRSTAGCSATHCREAFP
jgi:hypothetical protein